MNKFKENLADLYVQFLKELDEYEKDPYRNRHNFWTRDESFEAFMKWVMHGYFS